jgi:5S rRNA maturation endonuclease (ribonuclease M5)
MSSPFAWRAATLMGHRPLIRPRMDYAELHEDLVLVIDDLIEKNRRAPIIVEGEYDRRSLRALGVEGDIRVLNRGTSVLGLCEAIAQDCTEAIILTDWDVRGGRIARQLRDGLSANSVRFDDGIRARLTLLCRKDIKDVESLHAFAERVAEKASVRDQQRPSHRFYSERVRARDDRRRSRS